MSTVANQAKVYQLIKSMALFEKKKKEEGSLFVNGRLPPQLRKQMESILKQAKQIEAV